MKNIILITGASSGIGAEFARQMDRTFSTIDEIWLVARREKELLKLSKTLRHRSKCFPLDITNETALDFLESQIRFEKAKVCVLVNCAGYGIMGTFAKQDRQELTGMVRLNCEALTSLTHRMIPYMRKNSRIIQLASSAAFMPQMDFTVYAASKSYVLSFSRALREELLDRHIYVTAVCPGPVDTPFFDRAEKNGNTLKIKGIAMVEAKDVVSLALKDSYHKKATSVCHPIIKTFHVVAKMVPHTIMLKASILMKEMEQ